MLDQNGNPMGDPNDPQNPYNLPPSQDPATSPAATAQLADLMAAFPWAGQIGLNVSFFQNLIATSASDSEIVARVRQTSQYKQRFPAITAKDGTMRMNEAQYLATEDSYRQVLNQGGFGGKYDPSNPQSLVGFFESNVDPNELKQRVDTYNGIEASGQAVKDAFYVYAGLKVSTDDLFAAAVDPAAAQNLSNTYNQAVAKNPFDYHTWITRATQVGLDRVASTLTQLQAQGAVTGDAVQNVLQTDPNFARQIMDAIYTGGTGQTPTSQLNLDQLLHSFEYAALGAAATNAGLSLPTRERIAEIQAAGVTRSQAAQLYTQFGNNQGVYNAAVQRAGGAGFNQQNFEDAAFLGSGPQSQQLAVGLARENAAGQAQGQVRFGQDSTGRITQGGLSSL